MSGTGMTGGTHLDALRAVVARRAVGDDAAEVLEACRLAEAAALSMIGHQLFTVMRLHPEVMEVERLYSSRPDAYPPGGRKAKRDTPWGAHVLTAGKPYLGRGADDIRWAFDDHAVILGLGLETVINLPLRQDGVVIGTMNLLSGAGALDETHLATAETIADLLANFL
ncbi:MAG: GAF domain-containing protein [Pseudomonadota bacterium]